MERLEVSKTRSITGFYRLLGYLAVWPSMYALGVYTLLVRVVGNAFPDTDSIVYILLIAHSCYLLDRVKISDARFDPADALALPDRAMLFSTYSKPIRILVCIELLGSTGSGWLIHPVLGVVPLLALIGVHLYAGRGATPSAPRLKDLPGLKAFFIASGHLALSIAVLWGNTPDLLDRVDGITLAGILGVWLIVSGDAALCDVDDHETDRVYATKSIAVMFGKRAAWRGALTMIVIGSAFTLVGHFDQPGLLFIGSTLILSTVLSAHNTNHRDFVDARLLPIVLIGVLIFH